MTLSYRTIISIHAPREGSDVDEVKGDADRAISIHAPREGSDLHRLARHPVFRDISIHAPREGSDLFQQLRQPQAHISIHAPREGSDRKRELALDPGQHFYPRSPRGERPEQHPHH